LPEEAGNEKNLLRVDKEVIVSKIKQSKLSWKPSESNPNADYKLYWSNATPVSYNSKFIRLGNITEVGLPDILDDNEISGESIYLGISAVDARGNESDIITLSEPYKLSAPTAPVDLKLTTLNFYKITNEMKRTNNQDTEKQKQVSEKTDQEVRLNYRSPAAKFVTTEGKIVDAFDNAIRKTFEF